MGQGIDRTSQHKAARVAGIAYVLVIACGLFAEFFVRARLIVPGDAAATAANLVTSESVFRFGLAGDLAMLTFDVVLALAFYVLLEPVNRALALLAAFFRLVMDAILGLNLLNVVAALMFLGGADYLAAFDSGELQALAMSALEAHSVGYNIGLIPFGCATLVLGYLLFVSRYVPRPLAVLLSAGGLVYLVGSFTHVLVPGHVGAIEGLYLVPFAAESALALWLLSKGAKIPSASAPAASASA